MTTERVDSFISAVGATATVHTSTVDHFIETVTDVITEPAIGTAIGLDGVSLDNTPVETDLTPATLAEARTGVTPAAYALTEYGSLAIPTDSDGTELVSLYTSRHVAVLPASQIVPDMKAAYERFADSFSMDSAPEQDEIPTTQVFATGPSATADMGTLVQGVHGPDEVQIILVEDR